MFLSDFVKKELYANAVFCGVCLGVGVSVKTNAVKYLLCSSEKTRACPDFVLPISAVLETGNKIQLRSLRTVRPKSCLRLFQNLPVYTFDGRLLGNLTNAALPDRIATEIFIDSISFPIREIYACADAVILRKEQPYPLGQRIPAPLSAALGKKNERFVTKPILRAAIQNGALLKLTLSLPPFAQI